MDAILNRSRSKDRISSGPGPTYMSSRQMGEYLEDLRNNRVARPTGARQMPRSSMPSMRSARAGANTAVDTSLPTPPLEPPEPPSRSASALSHRQADSSTTQPPEDTAVEKGRPLIKQPRRSISPPILSAPYVEGGHRWMEKQEMRSISRALQDMDLAKEKKEKEVKPGEGEERLFNAARDEAAELVWKHQNPGAPMKNPDAPYRNPDHSASYREHLRKGVHTRRASWDMITQELHRSKSPSGGQPGSAKSSRKSSGQGKEENAGSPTMEDNVPLREDGPTPQAQDLKDHAAKVDFALKGLQNRRKSSGTKRKASGGTFADPKDQIYQEPEEIIQPAKPVCPAPAPVPTFARRNPFSRVQAAREQLTRSSTDPLSGGKRFNRFEIHRNPPSQSRNADYRSNEALVTPPKSVGSDTPKTGAEEVKTKNGIEIRDDDIRAATSKQRKDRSPHLPSPTVVSDKPGRPIVSFDKDWKPKEVELQGQTCQTTKSTAPPEPGHFNRTKTFPVVKQDNVMPPIPTINFPDEPSSRFAAPLPEEPSTPTISIREAPSVPTINLSPARPMPTISVSSPAVPTINVSPTPPVPSISVSPTHPVPTISVSASGTSKHPSPTRTHTQPIPTISAPSDSPSRPLPQPGPLSTRPLPRTAASANVTTRGHWTPTAVRTGALCASCALPISGRIVSAAGLRFHPECFGCHHCGELLECVAFYPEPEISRADRVERIQRRQAGGDDIVGPRGEGEIEDGDEGMRFYCHLDFHEFFSPRCKSCKTPIEGEVVVACGAEWHVGHFFCAQCGDPFDPQTPFVEKDGYAWCVNCHTNRYSTKCKKCRKPVTDTVLKALGAEWHQQCFVCGECGGGFVDGRYFLRDTGKGDSVVVCVGCEERRLKA